MPVRIPLTLAPLLVYNLVAAGLFGATAVDLWFEPVFTVSMLSDARFTLLLGDLMILAGLLCLAIEIAAAVRTPSASLAARAPSVAVFLAHLIEFPTVAAAATSVFLALTAIALVDAVLGTVIARRRLDADD